MNNKISTGINKKFINPNKYTEYTKTKSEYELAKEIRLYNASKLKSFGGKRFLGLTPKGNAVYVKYNINKSDKSIDISFTHKLSTLLKEDAKLANDRYTWPINAKVSPSNYRRMTAELRKNRSQAVTKRTLHWLKRLEELVTVKYYKAFKNKIPTKGMIQHITHMIFTGTYLTYETPSWHEIVESWDFPNGEYFNPEEAWNYPDVL